MRIAVDAMGGDHAPKEIILGAIKGCEELGLDVDLVGQETEIKLHLRKPSRGSIEIHNADEVISNDEPPVMAIRRKKNSSIVQGLRLVKDGSAQAFVSAGSTGALMAGGLFLLGRFEGVDRPAIAAVLPTAKSPAMLLDIGANSDVKPENLVEFALMGDVYVREILGRKNPRVALLNIGVEEEKGNLTIKSAYKTLSKLQDINFIGNVEARSFFDGNADIVIADGFTGNIFLKTIEGFGSYLFQGLKRLLKGNPRFAFGGMLIKPAIEGFKAQLDYSEYGGAMFLGLKGLVIKAHGSSKSKAIYNALRASRDFHDAGILEKMQVSLKDHMDNIYQVE